jgi:membrane-bound lytic murein transglycosylase D
MRVAKLKIRIALLAGIALASSACQSGKKPVAVLPAKSAAPPIATASPASATPKVESQASATTQAEATPAPPAEAQPGISSPPPDPVGDLIAQVEKNYQQGLGSYKAGQTDAAKQNFDLAFNALLGSTLDIRSDDRLEKEFDHIVEGVNQLDLGGLSSDDNEARKSSDNDAQKSEPAPIDETSGITPSADPNVKAKAQRAIASTHSDLPLMMTDQVAGYISYFSNRGRGTFERAFARSGRYHDMMVSILRQEGVPQDLIYLAQAESGFHPLAVSRAGARGIWQFMGSRAQGYGLHRSMWIDERQDPEKSTRAAARHLKDLYSEFGDWYLAMAAYNSGPGTVQAAVKRTGYADFWELYRRNVLPKETRNYVPIILAMTIVSKNLSQYGFDDVSMEYPAAYDSVSITYPVDLRLVADCVGSTPAQLQDLNPSLLRWTTPKDGKFELHLPPGTKDQYETAIADIPAGMRLWWRYPAVHPGDTLASLARNYHTTVKSINEANHLDGSGLEIGANLIVPVAPGKHPDSDTVAYSRRIVRYKVRRGDTVEKVAENFGVSPQMVRRWNGLHGDGLRGRRVLALHLPITPNSEVASAGSGKSARRTQKTAQVAGARVPNKPAKAPAAEASDQASPLRHKVKSGETLYSIANTYNTTVAALKRSNGNLATLRPGMILIVQPSQ